MHGFLVVWQQCQARSARKLTKLTTIHAAGADMPVVITLLNSVGFCGLQEKRHVFKPGSVELVNPISVIIS